MVELHEVDEKLIVCQLRKMVGLVLNIFSNAMQSPPVKYFTKQVHFIVAGVAKNYWSRLSIFSCSRFRETIISLLSICWRSIILSSFFTLKKR
jgi:hypothetical protein